MANVLIKDLPLVENMNGTDTLVIDQEINGTGRVEVSKFVRTRGGIITGDLQVDGTLKTGNAQVATKADVSAERTYADNISTRVGKLESVLQNTAESHNCLYVEKEFTVDELSARVRANNFSDVYPGSYFRVSFSTAYGSVNNMRCFVGGINYFKNCGDTATQTPHVVIVPEGLFGSAQMNSTHTTANGYIGSAMHTTVLPAIASALKNAIGASHVLSQRRLLTTVMNSSTASMAGAGWTGASTGWAWTSCDLCLMSEPMLYGTTVFSSSFYDVGDRKQMLPLFSLNPQLANIRSNFWLSAVASSTRFAYCHGGGHADDAGAGYSHGVRPFFCFS